MKYSKNINSFNTETDFENYINSVQAGFPNVAVTKDDNKIHYTQTSPNDYVIYGKLNETINPFTVRINNTSPTVHIDTLNNMFYLEQSDLTSAGISTITSLEGFMNYSPNNIVTVSLTNIDLSSCTTIQRMFEGKNQLKTVDFTGVDLKSNVNTVSVFYQCSGLTDVYISKESTLNVLTNNLSSQDGYGRYIPANNGNTTIHYNGIDYKWQNNAWTAQS